MLTFDFDELMAPHDVHLAVLDSIYGETPGQAPQLDQPESTPGCRDSYGHIHARPVPPAVHGESGWLQAELPQIFSNLAVWLAAARQADARNDGEKHQEGAGGPSAVSSAHPQPEHLEAQAEGVPA